MTKFKALDPQEARKIEEKAVEEYSPKIEKKAEKTPINGKQQPILTLTSIFPFKLFPDKLLIFDDRITIIKKLGPGMEQVRHIHLKEIAQTEADCGPIFGHLHIIPKLRTEEVMTIDRISRAKALEARELIESLIDKPLDIKESVF